MNILDLPTEIIWNVLHKATPATRVQTLCALGWFDFFWSEVFAMCLEDIVELMQTIGTRQKLNRKQIHFYMSILRNWC